MTAYRVEIIAVGTELLLGNVANTDAQFLSEMLASVGVDVLYHTAVGDNPARLREVVDIARGRANLLVFTGGLGPTYDDMTKQIVCEAFGLGLEFHPEIVEEIRHYFDTVFRREMPACNLQQAYLPRGCTVLHNPVGTAPGCIFETGGVTAVLLPGVPHECRHLAEHELLPWLRGQGIAMQRQKTVLAGSSYGGIASSWVALRYPRLFGNVLSLSGSYWWAPKGDAPGWLTRQYQQSPPYPVRFWLQAGKFETTGPGGGIYRTTQDFEQVLKEKGYRVSFHPSSSGHDYAAWCEALIHGMRDLTGLRRQ